MKKEQDEGYAKPRQAAKAKPVIYIIVTAPLKTKDVLIALRDYEPMKGFRYSFEKRKSFMLLFSIQTENGFQAIDLAKKRLKEMKLDELEGLSVEIY